MGDGFGFFEGEARFESPVALTVYPRIHPIDGLPVPLSQAFGPVRTRVRALILENAFASIPAMARHLYPFLPTAALVRSRYDSLSKIPRVGVPVLILHSRHDPLIPYAQGQALYAAAAEPKAFHTIEAATHYDTYLSGGAAYWEALQRFLDTLPPAPVGDGCASAAGPAGAGAERAPVQPPSGRL